MNVIVEMLYLAFSAISLYMVFLFILLFYENKKRLSTKLVTVSQTIPSVSIIVPSYNEHDKIADTIRSLKALRYPKGKVEIIIVDDGSTDGTYSAAKKFSGIRILRQENRGKGSALNLGLRHSRSDLVACVDADSRPMPDALEKAVPYFNEPGVGGVTASIFAQNKGGIVERLQWLEYVMIVFSRKLFEFIESIYVTPGPFSIFRRDVLTKVGGFDENVITEDIEIAWKMLRNGYKIRMARDARVLTMVPSFVSGWWRQRVRWNVGGIQTVFKHLDVMFRKEYGSLGRIVAPFFVSSYIISIVGLGLVAYLVGDWIYVNTSFTTRAYTIGVDPLSHYEFLLIPDIFTFFGLAVFLMSLVWVKISLDNVKEEPPVGGILRRSFELLLYLTLYITVFPINLLYSGYRYLKRDVKW
jgi:cellulose synthase/poly-beta-1,6-N-acetylglucosamine synthase-like glycosyltransferase